MDALSSDYFLILGGSSDLQLQLVKEDLDRRGFPVLFVDHDCLANASFDVSREGAVTIKVDGRSYGPPTLVWIRTKLRSLLGSWGSGAGEEFVRRVEWNGFIYGIEALFRDRAIFSQGNLVAAATPMLQFVTAAKAGFRIPHSRIFLGKEHAEEMLSEHIALVAKPLSVRNVPRTDGSDDFERYRVMMVMGVNETDVRTANAAEFECAPIFFQERLPNGVEYRVVAFRQRAFSYRCKEKVETRVRPDERMHYSGTLRGRDVAGSQFSPVETPQRIAECTRRFLEDLNLVYGAFDIIETDDGELFFLEFNPEGQWVACGVESLQEVTRHFTDELVEKFQASR